MNVVKQKEKGNEMTHLKKQPESTPGPYVS